jgi:dynein heavy chain
LFNEIDTDAIKLQAENYTKIVNRCIKNLPPNPVAELLKTLVFEFKNTMPVVMALRNKNLREHHLEEIK